MSSDQSTTYVLPLHYDGQPLRMGLDAQGQLICVATDLARALGYRDAANAVRILDTDEYGYSKMSTPGGPQDILYVTESGLYHLVFASRRDEAKTFRRWVTDDILPSLRRTGRYEISQAPLHQAPPPSTLTPGGMLPPPAPRVREHAEISSHLLSVFVLLRDTPDWLTNRDVAQRTGIAERTARAHTRYLLQVGVIERREAFPRNLHRGAPQAAQHNAGVYERLCEMAEIVAARQQY